MYLLRTKFKKEIVAEFLPAQKKSSNKVMIFLSGMPGYPDREKYTKIAEFFSKRGYWCFAPRYRGTWESEGKLFLKSPHQDVLDIIDELPKGFTEFWDEKKFIIKNPSVYLIGSSFGGPAALLCSKDKRVKKVICFSPVLDWREEKNTKEPIHRLSKFVKNAFGAGYRIASDGWKKIEEGKMYNPATEILKIDGKKVLIFHAKDDDIVSFKPLYPFIEKTNSTLILFKKGGHLGMSILKSKFFKPAIKFLNKK